ncbi:MAG: ribosome-associated translation inhibitor RaiA [Rickettsiaceae bacterium]|jgi:ribosomal subunit interface protein|nr:ribosome-associated translation inhibitor RaiA [Rickettsiaceae bacterium]WPX99455.1 HPF/RaiA family ribosome-associated protein [Candidatus Megaera polyxenophila]
MQVSVSGQHLSIGLSLQEYVKERMGGSIKKYFDHAPSATVHFNKQNHDFSCDIVVNDGTGRHIVIKSNASSDDVYFAFDAALSKIEKQLRKYKSKLKDHSSKMKVSEVIPTTTKYVISPTKIDDEVEDQEIDLDNPVIVAEKATKILKLSVGQAVMKMDLEDLPALMFRNVKTDRINVVYYRKDGNISWVDSY